MTDLIGRVAVVIGAARGVGRSLATRAAREGMCVVLADVKEEELRRLAGRLRKRGAEVLSVPTDPSRADAVAALARRTIDAFGAVHLLFNCASISERALSWESARSQWETVMNVNLWGMIHGIQAFVPLMLAQASPGHIVNAVSFEALLRSPSASMQAANAAVVALTENLEYEFRWHRSRLHASVLCSARRLSSPTPVGRSKQIADAAFDGIRDHQLYIVTETRFAQSARKRCDALSAIPG
jgi:NAD(P)-dependent dehydrogenase (short-subunit alcohol dehydrogenase family)